MNSHFNSKIDLTLGPWTLSHQAPRDYVSGLSSLALGIFTNRHWLFFKNTTWIVGYKGNT